MNALLDDLAWRGFLAHTTDLEALAADLDAGSIRFYVGFDPTAPSIHMGNLVQMMLARRFQAAGHRPVLVVGGSTGMIGDPKQTGERVLNEKETVQAWVKRIGDQVSRYVDFDGPAAAIVVNNYDWTVDLGTLDFLRDIGKYFSVNRMLDREVVKSRLESGISYTEFSYVLLQSLDYLELFRRHGCILQTGGSDQWGNITAGVELIRRVEGARVHALATPLLTKADGTKFGKTESGTVWLDPALTSPYAFHQFFLNAEDEMVVDYLKVFSERTHDEIDELARVTKEQPHLRAAQKALADDVTDLVHGEPARIGATTAADALFGRGDLRTIDAALMAQLAGELHAAQVSSQDGQMPSVIDALAASKVVSSRGEARRAIQEGGAYVNNLKVTDVDARISGDDLLAGGYVVVRRGKKTVGMLQIHS
ncbi:MAG: tyrosine--tRNA ligase [Propionibacteriaceae bacterium]|nr:tyrosine--tRNA ligase [Propionibacteriaceae bacterium]